MVVMRIWEPLRPMDRRRNINSSRRPCRPRTWFHSRWRWCFWRLLVDLSRGCEHLKAIAGRRRGSFMLRISFVRTERTIFNGRCTYHVGAVENLVSTRWLLPFVDKYGFRICVYFCLALLRTTCILVFSSLEAPSLLYHQIDVIPFH